jgi:hypothetical protein
MCWRWGREIGYASVVLLKEDKHGSKILGLVITWAIDNPPHPSAQHHKRVLPIYWHWPIQLHGRGVRRPVEGPAPHAGPKEGSVLICSFVQGEHKIEPLILNLTFLYLPCIRKCFFLHIHCFNINPIYCCFIVRDTYCRSAYVNQCELVLNTSHVKGDNI